MEDRRYETGDHRFHREHDNARLARFHQAGRANRRVRQRWDAAVRTADVCAARVHDRPGPAAPPTRPQWKETEPYKSILAAAIDDESAAKVALTLGSKEMLEVAAGVHSAVDVEAVDRAARDWIGSARNATFRKRYADLAYQPMLELLAYLRTRGFKTFIVTGGGADFVRALAEDAYGIPPEQVLGVAVETTMEMRDGKPVLLKGSKFTTSLDGPGKPVAIHHQIGRRPVMAFGNSDGDLQMLQYTATGPGPRFAAIVHHTDEIREVAYDRTSKIGKLDKALDEARAKGWTVIDLKEDWKTIFPNRRPK